MGVNRDWGVVVGGGMARVCTSSTWCKACGERENGGGKEWGKAECVCGTLWGCGEGEW